MRHSASLQLKGLQNCGRSKLKAQKDIHVSGEEFFFIFITLTSYSSYPLELQELVLHCKKYNTSSTWPWERPPKHWERKPAQNTTIWKQNSFGSSHLFIGSKENDILSFLECFPKNWNNAIVNRLDLNTLVSIPYEFIVSPKHWDWQIKEPWF